MGKLGIAKGTEEEVEIAVLEAFGNAVIHGNDENPEKLLYLLCRCSTDGEVTNGNFAQSSGTSFSSPEPN